MGSLGLDWQFEYCQSLECHDVIRQQNGNTGTSMITPDIISTAKELYIWLRGFQRGLLVIKELYGGRADTFPEHIDPLFLLDDWAVVERCREILAGMGKAIIVWDICDVQALAPSLTDLQSWRIINYLVDHHSPEYGLTWNDIRNQIREIFPNVVVLDEPDFG
jgi:hypothetical protein